jgi:phosphoribosylformylglycinamidine synthase
MHQSESIDVCSLSHEDLKLALAQNNIALTPTEAITISKDILNGRAPTIAELILWSIQGSEHCSYKSTKTYLKQLPNQAPHVVIAGKEDAGVIRIATDHAGKNYCLVLSHESHNHPSQIVPFEGAATGVGGNVRDVCCMGAEVIAIADGLRFGELSQTETHWIYNGVVSGIASYGNSIGVPNLAGDAYYHQGYNQNCLVTVVTLGIVDEDAITHSYAPKHDEDLDLILVGKPTDNSGFGGASFASADLNENDLESNKGAVQEPNPFLERHLLKASYALFDKLKAKKLIDKVGFKDLGAGGIACASVEIAEAAGLGATIDVDKVQVAMPGLKPEVILCAETQERFMWAVPKELTPMILDHYNKAYDLPNVSKNACATVVGHTTKDGQYRVSYQGQTLIDAPASAITQGLKVDRPCKAPKKILTDATLPDIKNNYNEDVIALFNHINIGSRKPIYQHYDKQVQGRVIVERGVAAAGVVAPFNDNKTPEELNNIGIALSVSQNPTIGLHDAYACGVHAVIESCYKVISVGATPLAITDCLCFGNPEKPEQMHALVQSIQAIKDTCETFRFQLNEAAPLPCVAGNVSLYNESESQAIPASPMISCVGKLKDTQAICPPTCNQIDQAIYLVGSQASTLQNSLYQDQIKLADSKTDTIDIETAYQIAEALLKAQNDHLVSSAQIINEGGLIGALAKLFFRSEIGATILIESEQHPAVSLFGETPAFVVTVEKNSRKIFENIFAELPLTYLGQSIPNHQLIINDYIDLDLNDLHNQWSDGLRKQL